MCGTRLLPKYQTRSCFPNIYQTTYVVGQMLSIANESKTLLTTFLGHLGICNLPPSFGPYIFRRLTSEWPGFEPLKLNKQDPRIPTLQLKLFHARTRRPGPPSKRSPPNRHNDKGPQRRHKRFAACTQGTRVPKSACIGIEPKDPKNHDLPLDATWQTRRTLHANAHGLFARGKLQLTRNTYPF
jgi:hypothetical protein